MRIYGAQNNESSKQIEKVDCFKSSYSCTRCEQDGKLGCDSLHFQLQEGQCQLRYYTSQDQSVRFLGVFEPNSQKRVFFKPNQVEELPIILKEDDI
jgi:hypothetical protein